LLKPFRLKTRYIIHYSRRHSTMDMSRASVPTKSLAYGVNLDLAPTAVGAMCVMNNMWLPCQGQDLRCGYGGQSYGWQADHNFSQPNAMLPGVQGPVTMQQNAEWTPASGDADFAGKGAGGRRVNRQPTSEPTTIFFRNVPNNCNGEKILELLNNNGLKDTYNFVYVPHDFKRLPQLVTLGYFFVNFVSHEFALMALDKLVGFKEWESLESTKVLDASWAKQPQGLKACIKRYRNCPVMHETVPDECKPMTFENGVLVPLAASKKKIKQPRFKKGYLVDGKSISEAPAGALDNADTTADSGDAETETPATDDPDRQSSFGSSGDRLEDMGVQSSSIVRMPDESTVGCSWCEETFTMFRRQHHCRACGLICCAECAPRTSSNWPKILGKSQELTFERLCKGCQGSQACVQGRPSSPPAHSEIIRLSTSRRNTQAFVKNTFIDIKEDPDCCTFAGRHRADTVSC